MKAHETVNACNTLAINSTVPGTPGNFNVDKSGLSQNTLDQPFKTGRIEPLSEDCRKLVLPSFLFREFASRFVTRPFFWSILFIKGADKTNNLCRI